MSKRKERKEEEARILRELDEAVAQERGETPQKEGGGSSTKQEEVFHCKRCKTKMEGGVCPTCGYTMYQPMSEEKRKKIRRVVAVACVGVFVLLFLLLRLK